MLLKEAKLISRILKKNIRVDISQTLIIGSSTLDFREALQPYIKKYIYKLLESKSARVTNLDAKNGPGIDITVDITDKKIVSGLRSYSPDLIICSNLLEHVVDIKQTIKNICRILPPGGYLLISGPLKYPIHHDPIDNNFRPSKREVEDLFPDFEVIKYSTTSQHRLCFSTGFKMITFVNSSKNLIKNMITNPMGIHDHYLQSGFQKVSAFVFLIRKPGGLIDV